MIAMRLLNQVLGEAIQKLTILGLDEFTGVSRSGDAAQTWRLKSVKLERP